MKIDIIHTNDMHSTIEKYGKISRFKQDRLQVNSNTLLIDAGDVLTGNIYYNLFKGEIESSIIKYVGYDYQAIGNHDVDDGLLNLGKYIRNQPSQFIHSNSDFSVDYRMKNTNVKNAVIHNFDELKVGFISVTTDVIKHYIEDDSPVAVTPPLIALQKIVDEIRPQVDLLIAINHIGIEVDIEVAQQFAIDVIISAHSHTITLHPVVENNTLIVQAGCGSKYLGHLELEYAQDKLSYNYQLIDFDNIIDTDGEIEELIAREQKKVVKYTKTILGSTTNYLCADREIICQSTTNLGMLVCDSFIFEASKVCHIDFAIINARGIRKSIEPGQITLADTYGILPFSRNVVIIEITGENIRLGLNEGVICQGSRLHQKIDVDGQKQLFIIVDNQLIPLDDDKLYTVVTNDYVAAGFSYLKHLSNNHLVATLGIDNEVLASYIKTLSSPFTYDFTPTIEYI